MAVLMLRITTSYPCVNDFVFHVRSSKSNTSILPADMHEIARELATWGAQLQRLELHFAFGPSIDLLSTERIYATI